MSQGLSPRRRSSNKAKAKRAKADRARKSRQGLGKFLSAQMYGRDNGTWREKEVVNNSRFHHQVSNPVLPLSFVRDFYKDNKDYMYKR